MKNFILFLMLGFFTINLNAQALQVTITFSAEMDASHIPLDSISIKNLTQGGDTMLYGLDTVLVLQSTSIDELERQSSSLIYQSYPNPFREQTNFSLFVNKTKSVKISIYDLSGRKHLSREESLVKGLHDFSFYPGNENIYLLSVEDENERFVKKLVNIGSGNQNVNLTYNGLQHYNDKMLKSGKTAFSWMPGDKFLFTAFAAINTHFSGSDIVTANIYQDEQFIFNILHGLPCVDAPYVEDVDGNIYQTIQIGTQCWMKENLKVTQFPDGTPIPYITVDTIWGNQSGEDKAYTYYNNNTNNEADVFGALYTWAAAVNGTDSSNSVPSQIQGVCPDGWHLPSDAEWEILENYLIANGYNYDTTTTDNKIAKSVAARILWSENPNEGVVGNNLLLNNSSGFTVLPSSHRDGSGAFPNPGNHAKFWSTTAYNQNTSWTRNISFNSIDLFRVNYNKRNGYSVRCVKN